MAITISTDAAYLEQYAFNIQGMHLGYLWHDYGAVPFQVNPTYAWTETSPADIAEATHWFGSAGATAMGASVGEAAAFNTQTIHVPVTGTCPVGSHVLLAFAMTNDLAVESSPPSGDISVTDNKGGNALQFGAIATIGFDWVGKFNIGGVVCQGWTDLYRINTQLIAGDTITVTFSGFTVYEVRCRLHVVTGLNSPDPNGPNAGGNFVEFSTSQNGASSPKTLTFIPAPKYVGPTLQMAGVVTLTQNDYEISFARGGPVEIRAPGSDPSGKTSYEQVGTPEMILGAGCSIEVASLHPDGTVKTEDQISDVRLWVEDR